jgi:hypothetical protein
LEREAAAIALHAAGLRYDEIAAQLGYAGPSGAFKALNRGLGAERDRRAGQHLQTQLDRLEAIHCAHWQAATEGHDVRAAQVVLSVLAEMDKLLGLDHRDKRSGRSMPVKPWGIVMTGEERTEWEAAGSPTHWNR